MSQAKQSNEIMEEIGLIKKTMFDMKSELEHIRDVVDDKFLSADDKIAIDKTLEAEKQGKLVSMDQVFK